MSARSVITITTGSAGSGKTWRRGPHYLVNEFLVHGEGHHISNFPLRVPELLDFVALRKGVDRGALEGRVELIPEAVLESWRAGESGPWEYFAESDLSGAHIAIDEAHHYCGSMLRGPYQKQWQAWLGEIRHRGATVEFLTQHPAKMSKTVDNEAAVRISLVNSEERRDPWFGIALREWYELRAKFTGEYRACVWELEKRQVDGRWKQQDKRVFWLEPEYFGLYDSFSAPQKGGVAGKPADREYQRRTWAGLLVWFVKRNWFRLGSRLVVVLFVCWLCFGGGFRVLFDRYMKTLQVGASAVSSSAAASGQGRGGEGFPTRAPVVDAKYRKQFQGLVSALEESREENRGLRGRLANLEKVDRESREFVCFFPGGAADSYGNVYYAGEEIKDGPFKGEAIKYVDVPRRSVVFVSGRAVVLRRKLQVDTAEGRLADVAALPAGLPRAVEGAGDASGSGVERVGAARNGERSGAGVGGVRKVVSTVDRSLNRSGAKGGGASGVVGGQQSVGGGLSLGGGTQGWNPASSDWQPVLSGAAPSGGPRGVGSAGAAARGR